jgi:protease-4
VTRTCLFVSAALMLLLPAAAAAEPLAIASDSLAPIGATLRSELAASRFVADVDGATALFVNPAGLSMRRSVTSLIQGTYWYDRLGELTLGAAGPDFGLGFSYTDNGVFTSKNYTVGLGAKLASGFSIGSVFTWHHTDLPYEHRSPFTVDLGFLARPVPVLSIGGVWKNVNEPAFAEGAVNDPFLGHTEHLEGSFLGGLSVRPIGEWLTISGQAEVAGERKPGWLFGGRAAVAPGVELFGSYLRDTNWHGAERYEEFSGGLAVWFGSSRVRAQNRSRVDGSTDYSRNSFAIERTDAFVRSAVHSSRYAEITIEGNYLDEGGGFSLMGGSRDLHAVLHELESVRSDADVKGLLVTIGPLGGGFIGPVSGNIFEIHEAIRRVKEAGKPVVAYLKEGGSSAELYIASAADRIVTPRLATVGVLGVSLEINRMKRLFEKLGIDFDHYTAGDYKSSFHTIYTDTTTAVQAEEIRSLVAESYRLLVEGIASGRGIPVEHMRELADGRVFSPDDLVKEHLVDSIGWEKDARSTLGSLAGASRPEKLRTGSIGPRTYWSERWTPPPAVAIVGAYGGIESGKSRKGLVQGSRTMGSETIVKQLKSASRYPGVRAIVFRVDSGGGSALASDEILEEIRRIQTEVKIPVIVSMGNVAASGGYWISMYGDRVFADPFTVTGSIGVVWFKPVLARLYEKIGVSNEVFKEGEHADALSWNREMTEQEMKMLGDYIDGMYAVFVDKVAESRKLDPGRVREIGGGRVYLGTQALPLKLVDEIGGLRDAVSYAAAKAGIADDYRTVYFKAFPGFFESIVLDTSPVGVARTLGRIALRDGISGFDGTFAAF